jgi:hypothetical protein
MELSDQLMLLKHINALVADLQEALAVKARDIGLKEHETTLNFALMRFLGE